MIRYVLFDFDGTLVDSKEVALSILNGLAGKYNFRRVEVNDLETLRNLSIPERCRFLQLPLYKLPLLAVEARGLYRKAIPEIRPFDGIKDLLEALTAQGFSLAVLSSNSEGNIRAFLRQNGIDTIGAVYSAPNIFGKDTVLRRFLKAHGLDASQVLYVGDELRDVVACRKCGVRVIWVGWGYDSLEAVSPAAPDFIVHAPGEILRVVQSAGA